MEEDLILMEVLVQVQFFQQLRQLEEQVEEEIILQDQVELQVEEEEMLVALLRLVEQEIHHQ